jgi:hypothetical protein
MSCVARWKRMFQAEGRARAKTQGRMRCAGKGKRPRGCGGPTRMVWTWHSAALLRPLATCPQFPCGEGTSVSGLELKAGSESSCAMCDPGPATSALHA